MADRSIGEQKNVLGRHQCSSLHLHLRSCPSCSYPLAPLLKAHPPRPNHEPPTPLLVRKAMGKARGKSSVVRASAPKQVQRSVPAARSCTLRTENATTRVRRNSPFWLKA